MELTSKLRQENDEGRGPTDQDIEEIIRAKSNKTSRENGITSEILKEGEQQLHKQIGNLARQM